MPHLSIYATKFQTLHFADQTMKCYVVTCSDCIVNVHGIKVFMNSSLCSCMSHKQDKEMDNLNLFIDYHYKSIVSIIRV